MDNKWTGYRNTITIKMVLCNNIIIISYNLFHLCVDATQQVL